MLQVMLSWGTMTGSGRRRVRKRVTVELEPYEEHIPRDLRLEAIRAGITLRAAVLEAMADWITKMRGRRKPDAGDGGG
jgi:hypothetical protein